MIVLRALGALLSYPQEEIRQALPEIAEAIRASQMIPAPQREDLLTLIDELAGDLLSELLGDCAHILRRIGQSLIARGSRYTAVLQTLLVIAGEDPIDIATVPRVAERIENLDRDWFEQPAFGGEPLAAGASVMTPSRRNMQAPR